MAKLLFLGRLEDLADGPEREVSLAGAMALGDVLAQLPQALRAALVDPRIRIACNGTLVSADGLVVADGDEIAFLPPVSGGHG